MVHWAVHISFYPVQYQQDLMARWQTLQYKQLQPNQVNILSISDLTMTFHTVDCIYPWTPDTKTCSNWHQNVEVRQLVLWGLPTWQEGLFKFTRSVRLNFPWICRFLNDIDTTFCQYCCEKWFYFQKHCGLFARSRFCRFWKLTDESTKLTCSGWLASTFLHQLEHAFVSGAYG